MPSGRGVGLRAAAGWEKAMGWPAERVERGEGNAQQARDRHRCRLWYWCRGRCRSRRRRKLSILRECRKDGGYGTKNRQAGLKNFTRSMSFVCLGSRNAPFRRCSAKLFVHRGQQIHDLREIGNYVLSDFLNESTSFFGDFHKNLRRSFAACERWTYPRFSKRSTKPVAAAVEWFIFSRFRSWRESRERQCDREEKIAEACPCESSSDSRSIKQR